MTTEITTSHDPRDWREAFETTEPGPELDRIRARVAAARQRGENDAIVAVVLSEASGWRERALQAEAIVASLTEVTTHGPIWAERPRTASDGGLVLDDSPVRYVAGWQLMRRLVTPWEVAP